MSDRIRDALAQRIIDGVLPAGERLVELSIAREFDTSQTPVREALRELEALKLVESVPYRGTRVREITAREMAEAYAVRGALEQMAAREAGPRVLAIIPQLNQHLDELVAAADRKDLHAFAAANLCFHRTIVAAAGNQVLLSTWETLGFETRMRVNLARQPVNLHDRVPEHRVIVQALAAGNTELGGQLLLEHARSFMTSWENQSREHHPPINTSDQPGTVAFGDEICSEVLVSSTN